MTTLPRHLALLTTLYFAASVAHFVLRTRRRG
jgi:hypothetical protein